MENNIASILFAKGIMPDNFISYSTYAAVAEIVKEVERLKAERQELVEALRELLLIAKDKHYVAHFHRGVTFTDPECVRDINNIEKIEALLNQST